MLRLAADENLSGRILRGLRRALPEVDVVRIQDSPVAGTDDDEVLAWAAGEGRVLVTHDVSTLVAEAYKRVQQGLQMPGVNEVPGDLAIGRAVSDLVLLVTASLPGEWDGQVLSLPL